MQNARSCSLALFMLGSSACADTPRSCDLSTEALVLRATVSDLEHGVEVEVELETASESDAAGGLGTTLALCPDSDHLEINGIRATEVYALGHLYYVASFDAPAPSYEISLQRNDYESVSVSVDMPPTLEIIEPNEGASPSRANALQVDWAPAWTGHLIELRIEDEIGSSCLEDLGVADQVDDTGSHSVAANSLVGGGAAPNACKVTLTLTRVLEAEYPAALAEGGQIRAVVKRRRLFTSVE